MGPGERGRRLMRLLIRHLSHWGKLIRDVTFHNGVEVTDTPEQTAA